MNFALRMYRRLAAAFPHEFNLAYGTDVQQLGEEVIEDVARQQGLAGLVRLLADIAIRVPVEYATEMRRDMRYAVRGLIKSPGFALVGIVSLGLGMGVTTSVFTRLWTHLFRSLPAAEHPENLAAPQDPVSYYAIEQYRAQKNLFTGAAAFETGVAFNIGFAENGNAKPQRVFGQLVSADYFTVLGVKAQRGRLFAEARPGAAAEVVITDHFWRSRMDASPDVLGRILRVNGQPATIVGITPRDFRGALPITPSDVFVPVTAPAALAPELADDVLHNRGAKVFQAMLRVAPGVTFDEAKAGLDTITRRLEAQEGMSPALIKNTQITLLAGGGMVPIPREMKPVIVGFFAVLIGLILTIACMNLANMVLARGDARRRELAIRLAVGASRFRLIRQMLSEGILLAMLGGVAGLALAYCLSILSTRFRPALAVPIDPDYSLDWRAFAFTAALALLCGIGFSLAPALQATKAGVAATIKEGAADPLRAYRRFGLRNVLVVGQVAGSLMLLLITGFLIIGFSKTANVHTRFDENAMVLMSIDPVRDGETPEKARLLFTQLPDRLKAVSGVTGMAMAAHAPFLVGDNEGQATVGKEGDSAQTVKPVVLKSLAKDIIGAGYFATLSEPMVAGREFGKRDEGIDIPASGTTTVALPVVLSESAARGFFGGGNAIGQRLIEDKQEYEVIGVARDLQTGITDGNFASVLYLPMTGRDFSNPPATGITLMVRLGAGGDAGGDTALRVRREISSLDPNLSVFNVRTLGEYLDMSRAYMRFTLDLYGGIGLFGILLAGVGLAGVTAYAVARRKKEIGIRMALGARKAQVLRLVLREGMALVAAGTALGFLGAAVVVKLLSSLTSIFADSFNVNTNDPRLVVGAPLLLAALAMVACYVPARRSAKIDPMRALREE